MYILFKQTQSSAAILQGKELLLAHYHAFVDQFLVTGSDPTAFQCPIWHTTSRSASHTSTLLDAARICVW